MPRSFRYEEIAEDLRQQIQSGMFPPEERLPSERSLMEQYSVQRNTIRQALSLLETDGWIVIRPKQGAFPTALGRAEAAKEERANALAAYNGSVILVVNAWNSTSVAVDRLLAGLSEVIAPTPLTVQRFDSRPQPGHLTNTMPTPEYLTANKVAGVILWPQNPADLPALTRLRDIVPTVLVDQHVPGFESHCVYFDDVSGGRQLTEHLIQQGHQRIGFLGNEAFAETVQNRWRGYVLALENAGIAPSPSWIGLFHGLQEPRFTDSIRLLLAGDGAPLTAVVCSNDSTALALLRVLREEGRQVPDDVAVTGYGNLLPDYLDALELTTIEQPFLEAGRRAGELLLDRLIQSNTDPARQIQLPARLILRRSSGASAAKL